ncbi:protein DETOXIFICATION 24-like isoform X2 [Chenopodium quinoa]|uniref:protein DETOXIFICATION 24-like isoform X2 n=1 Tax=Chenopodium quinoa TaxID=63459 RepID=UPI000B77B50E|nr:protein DETOXIFICATION 24-like isoform X2 [Chenopodium quinoa]
MLNERMDSGPEARLLVCEDEKVDHFKQRVWEESKRVWAIAFPAMVCRVTTYGAYVVSQASFGHIREVDLAAYALVQTILVRFANGILLGMASVTETLCGESFGAKQYDMMGVHLQRSWIVNTAVATMMVPFYIFATPLLRLLGQEEDIAVAAGSISLWFIPIMYLNVFGMTMQMYLQAQNKNMVVTWLFGILFFVHALLSWIFVYIMDWGLPGVMIALIIAFAVKVLGEVVYIFGGWCPLTWRGFDRAAFTGLMPVLKSSTSSGVMLCTQVWYNAILVLLAGYMKYATVAISAFSICLNVSTWELMICLGFLGAVCVRVSNELGRGNGKAAKFSVDVILYTSVIIGIFFWILCLAFGHQISYLFTSSEEVAKAVSDLSVPLAFSILLNNVGPVLSGVAIGCGSQGVVAIVNVCSYYVIGIPIGVLLAYAAHMEVKGIWIGMMCGMVTQTIALLYLTWKIDWVDEVKKASKRLYHLS